MEKPAIAGGNPQRSTPIYYGKQYIDEDDIKAVCDVLRSDYITCGPLIGKLEEKICKVTGAKYAVCVSNGTAALHIAAMAAGFKPGDEVIVSCITFAASANCIRYCGATPVFADIDPLTLNIDADRIESLITPKTKGIVAVDFAGQPVDNDRIRDICKRHNLVFIEDAAHAMGSTYKGKGVGSLADMTCFSFHPVKTVTCGEGGCVTTNDEDTYKHLLRLRSHGITRDQSQMNNPSDDPWYNEMVELGFNYRLTDFQAAMLMSQLDKLPKFIQRRNEIASCYEEAFKDEEVVKTQKITDDVTLGRHLYTIEIDTDKLTVGRREFFDALNAENIHCQVHYLPVYMHSYYEKLGYKKGLCPNGEKYYERALSLPLFYTMTDSDVKDVISGVKKLTHWFKRDK
ncbi:MAG: UDP-4-amino-4,6-dideoxy-N-acetyl-beta-L-altrosamine transaminase [Lachnospiraceae bacterium]|nr:UDP-4-amino-4,6-dideoxy-N-acetyl-beta-L-altrosamine transaminase [Lachnospiraceae bacterium]